MIGELVESKAGGKVTRGQWRRLTDYKSEIRQYEEGILYIKREQPINARSAAMGNQPRERMFEEFACLK